MNADSWRTRFAEASLALRFAMAVGLFGLVVAVAAATFGYWGLARQLQARLGADLEGKRSLLGHVLSETPSVAQIAADTHRLGDMLIGHKGLHLALIDQHTGRLLASFSPAAVESVARVKEQTPAAAFVRWDAARASSQGGTGTAHRQIRHASSRRQRQCHEQVRRSDHLRLALPP